MYFSRSRYKLGSRVGLMAGIAGLFLFHPANLKFILTVGSVALVLFLIIRFFVVMKALVS